MELLRLLHFFLRVLLRQFLEMKIQFKKLIMMRFWTLFLLSAQIVMEFLANGFA